MSKNYTPLKSQIDLAHEILKRLSQGNLREIAHELGKSVYECEWLIENLKDQSTQINPVV